MTAKCFAAGACTAPAQAVDAVVGAANARNLADAGYGFSGDPFFGRQGGARYYGPMAHAGWR